MEISRRTPPVWLIALFLIAGCVLWLREVRHPIVADVMPFQLASYFWRHGEPEFIYTTVAARDAWMARSDEVANEVGAPHDSNVYCHPPFFAALLAPFAEFPSRWWRNALLIVNHLLIGVLAWILLRAAGVEMSARWFAFALAILLCSFPLSWAVSIGQVGPILAVGVWLGLLALQRGREISGGGILGLFTAIKLFPIVFVALPLLHRQYRAVAVWLGTTVAIYAVSIPLLGTRLHMQWWNSLRDFMLRVDSFQGNQSIAAWAARISIPRDQIPWLVSDPFVDFVRMASLLILGSATLFVLWKCRKIAGREDQTVEAGLVILAVFLSTAVFWIHYLIYVLPVLAFAVYREWFRDGSKWGRALTAVAAFLIMAKLTHFYTADLGGRLLSGSHTMGALLLWVWCAIWLLNRSRREFAVA